MTLQNAAAQRAETGLSYFANRASQTAHFSVATWFGSEIGVPKPPGLDDSAPLNDPNKHDDDGQQEQNVNETTQRVRCEQTERP